MGVLILSDIPTINSYGGSTVPPAFPLSPERSHVIGGLERLRNKEQHGNLSQSWGTHLPGATFHSTTKTQLVIPSTSKATEKQKGKVVASGSPAWG